MDMVVVECPWNSGTMNKEVVEQVIWIYCQFYEDIICCACKKCSIGAGMM